MNLQIGPHTFDRSHYDRAADVLYLSEGDLYMRAVDFDETPDGHAISYDKNGKLIGLTLVDVSQLVEQAQGSDRLLLGLPTKIEQRPALKPEDIVPADVRLADLKHVLD
jgi:uncharacterized protein YuzE